MTFAAVYSWYFCAERLARQPALSSTEFHSSEALAVRVSAMRKPGIEQARHVLRPLDIAVHPVEAVGGAAESIRAPSCAQSSEHPGVLGAAALARIDDQRAFLSATRVRPPGTIWMRSETSTNGPEIDMARRQAAVGQDRQVDSARVGWAM